MAAPRKRTHGSGTILRRSNGRYTAQVTDRAGRRRSLGTFDTRREAERAISKGALAPGPGAGEHLTLGEYLTSWLGGIDSYVKPTTAGRYRIDTRAYVLRHPIAGIRLGKLRPDDFRQLYVTLASRGARDGRPLGDWTVSGVDRMLRTALHVAMADGLLATDDAVAIGARSPGESCPTPDVARLPPIITDAG